MDKMKMHSPNFTDENIAKLAEFFPSCITESKDADGHLTRAIDFDQLKQELSNNIVEGPQERYQLNWPGKREALLTANAPIAKTLRPCREESVNFDTTENLFIEGDNLDALKLMQESYLGKVKMIYIDPPYNTGQDFIYSDNFSESAEEYLLGSGQSDEEGNRLIANHESNGRFHSDWLSMMYSRLKLAKNLLKEDGLIFISIDDNEAGVLKKILDEIFGEKNFLASIIWKSRQIIDSRNKSNISSDHEYIFIYSKEEVNAKLRGKEVDTNKYSNPDNDPNGPWMSNTILGLADASQRPNLHYSIVDPETGSSFPCPAHTGWRYSKETMQRKILEKRILFPAKEDGRPREKKYLSEMRDGYTGFSSILSSDVGFTLNGSRELRELFGEKYFDFPKPVSLIKTLVSQVCFEGEEIVLDFFAGSATTAEAVMQLNSEDNGQRRFILVQLPESCDEKSQTYKAGYKTIADVSKERIRKSGKKIKESSDLLATDLDIGFRILKIDDSNMSDVYYSPDSVNQANLSFFSDNIKEDRSSEDLLFQVLLDWGVDLTLPISKETIAGREVFFVDGNALAACFDKQGRVDEEFCKELAAREPLRVVFRDAGFKDDSVKINVEQIFKLLSPHSDLKTI